MSHHQLVLITSALLFLSPGALAQSFSNDEAADLQPDSDSGPRIAVSPVELQQNMPVTPYWQGQSLPDFHLHQDESGVKLTPGQYYGNRGPASEEQGVQLLFSAQ